MKKRERERKTKTKTKTKRMRNNTNSNLNLNSNSKRLKEQLDNVKIEILNNMTTLITNTIPNVSMNILNELDDDDDEEEEEEKPKIILGFIIIKDSINQINPSILSEKNIVENISRVVSNIGDFVGVTKCNCIDIYFNWNSLDILNCINQKNVMLSCQFVVYFYSIDHVDRK